jgi:FHA domain-containing protein/zinc ribbon protein
MTHVHCPECGFQNLESSNYCSKCGALLIREEPGGHTTMTFVPEELVDEEGAVLEELPIEGTALVVRSGGGRQGETFPLEADEIQIGRSPDADVFLDDVTVSRTHAVLSRADGGYVIEDNGSLNGTYVNRRRVEKARLEDGDEVQIGKYRLTYLSRSA